MKEKIAEIQQYFIDKILNGDFKVTRGDKHKLHLLIDDEYPFPIWIANGKECIQPYDGTGDAFMRLPRFNITQREKIYYILEPEILKYTGVEYKRNQLKEQIEKLQEELNRIDEPVA